MLSLLSFHICGYLISYACICVLAIIAITEDFYCPVIIIEIMV